MRAAAHIREYGGTLEHFWIEAVKDRTDAEYLDAREIPASLVTELAADPNGAVLRAANGRPAQLYVIVPVDGTLRISFGAGAELEKAARPGWLRISVWMLPRGDLTRLVITERSGRESAWDWISWGLSELHNGIGAEQEE